MKNKYLKNSALVALAIMGLASCKKDKVEKEKPALRPAIDYAKLVDGTKYDATNTIFVDASGKSTIDLTTGNFRYRAFQGINTYAGTWKVGLVDANVLKNMYANTGNPFTAVSNPAPADFAALNASGVQLRNVTASSWADADAAVVRAKVEADLIAMATISASANVAAAKGTAGYVFNNAATPAKYLLDAKGFETQQLIQKGLIGAFDLDYIGNVLLNKGLDADNSTLVAGKNYTRLEQNWDEAYGSLTLNPIYLAGSTDAVRGTSESFIGSYIWEYGKPTNNATYNYTKVYGAFLRGRAAIVNNDKVELKKQADIIRNTMEKAIASAAIGYMDKWVAGIKSNDQGAATHALGEGLGFVYSLRFCALNKADAKFSDDLLAFFTSKSGGHWDFDLISAPEAALKVQSAIKTKFAL